MERTRKPYPVVRFPKESRLEKENARRRSFEARRNFRKTDDSVEFSSLVHFPAKNIYEGPNLVLL